MLFQVMKILILWGIAQVMGRNAAAAHGFTMEPYVKESWIKLKIIGSFLLHAATKIMVTRYQVFTNSVGVAR